MNLMASISSNMKKVTKPVYSIVLKAKQTPVVSILSIMILAFIVLGIGLSKKTDAAATGIQKIQHIIVITQENRSFDSYFGTYPGADGIPMAGGTPTVCNPDPNKGTCVKPYVNHLDVAAGGPHGSKSHVVDVDNGLMDGFITSVEQVKSNCDTYWTPECNLGPVGEHDVMGYKVASDIPNYWKYAQNFVLQDRMFEPTASWSLPAHLFQVSGWSANCSTHAPSSCVGTLNPSPAPAAGGDPTHVTATSPFYPWTDITYLLRKQSVSWGYYVTAGTEPDCQNDEAMSCVAVPQYPKTPGIWNPLAYFDTVRNSGQLGNIKSVDSFYSAAKAGTLPAVSWIVPANDVSEHPPSTTSAGQSYVTSLVNAVMRSPNWNSTAIFLSWDDWGGFYDHVVPPMVDENGYGIRVPGLLISPYAKHGYIDHQILSFDAFLKFIEDRFLGGQRLDPATDGRPDPRTNIREAAPILGNLMSEFDFNQTPRPPLLLPVRPVTTLTDRTPYAPQVVTPTAGDAQARLSWVAPLSDGGSPITSYKVMPYKAGVAQPVQNFANPGSRSVIEFVTGLTNGQNYKFQVAAVNQLGTGIWSPLTIPPIVVGAPLAPAKPSATAGQGYARVTFTAPTSDNGSAITGYRITPYVGTTAKPSSYFGPTVIPRTITGLTAGTTYTFVVAAINARGTGAPSAQSNAVTVTN